MRIDRDKRTDNEKEIDDFFAQFETPVEDLSTDVNQYLSDYDSSKMATKQVEKRSRASEHSAPASRNEGKRKNKKSSNSKKRTHSSSNVNKSKFSTLKNRLFLKKNPNYDPSKGSYVVVKGKKKKNKPYVLSIKKLFLDCIGLGVIMGLCCFIYAFAIISFAPKIDANDIYDAIERSSVIYDDQGKSVDSVFYNQDRTLVKYEDCPEDLVNAFVAIEDKTFWKHHGFNWTRMVGAVVSAVTGGGQISGTSTITQQLSRNVYLADIKSERSISRKILEMYYAAQIEKCLSKEEIIEAYMNTIYLGFGCYGVDAAAHAYYSKDVSKLNLEECASLAALPQAPDSYALVQYVDDANLSDQTTNIIVREPDTYVANDLSKDRRDTCLTLMKEQGYISESEYEKAYDKDLIDFIKPTIDNGSSNYAYFHEYLIDQVISDLMEEYDLTYADAESMVYTKGLKIYSTLDTTAQKTIVKEFKNSSNFPAITGIRYDSDDNILSKAGEIILYDYDDFFSKKGNFTFKNGECKVNDDGSVTIIRGKRLNIYTTEYDGQTDYSLEFKPTYEYDDTLYTHSGGYINIAADYKSLDSNDNLVIDASFFEDNPGLWKINGNKVTITEDGYTLTPKTIQPQAAMTIVGVGTGEVKAMVGGRTTKGKRLLNRALNARQPGSSIKPLAVYGAALQKSFDLQEKNQKWEYVDYGYDKQGAKGWGDYITASSSVVDEPMTVNGKRWPENAGGGYSGSVTFRRAIQQSINTCAVKIQLQVGTDYSIEMLKKFGLTSLVTSEDNASVNDENTAALALGGMTNGAIPLEMALAYASFPNGGERNSAIAYTKVVDSKGETILTSKSEKTKVMDEGVAWIMTDVLKSVVSAGIGSPASISGVQSGGKTGTTNDQYDIWFDGFTPVYAASLWIGTDNNIPLATMSGPAAALWGKIMNQIPNAKKGTYKTQPSNVIRYGSEYYTKGTETGLTKYNVKKKVKKDKKVVKVVEEKEETTPATPAKPSNPGSSGGSGNSGGSSGGNGTNPGGGGSTDPGNGDGTGGTGGSGGTGGTGGTGDSGEPSTQSDDGQ